ncbi:SAP domain-containing ribonucleoprotein [Smittium culicis]|uniref:SAP domain-containing ribonucleoprotein n=1 Tax=Smittium culicis TaxID=133412 RepID=A0A1R1X7E0_9FUNG|nr:SAP domain-containing ribonucleoprotein [Smittium culicis]OMJ15716.1 SAP domain-containing ribonucleoprotein [Smittium culicis]
MELDEKSLKKLKVPELKAILKERNLSVEGKKDELISRIIGSSDTPSSQSAAKLDANSAVSQQDQSKPETKNSSPTAPQDSIQKTQLASNISETTSASNITNDVSKNLKNTKELTESEKLKLRAEKFGLNSADSSILTEEEIKRKRSLRFGISIPTATPASEPAAKKQPIVSAGALEIDPEVLKKRAQRFGLPVAESTASSKNPLKHALELSESEKEKLLKRQQRFGTVATPVANSAATSSSAPEAAISEEEKKKRKRAERFGLTSA